MPKTTKVTHVHDNTVKVNMDNGLDLYYTMLSKKNLSNSGLTELNAEEQMRNGYATHSDFLAHAVRFAYAQRTITRVKPKRVLDLCSGRFPMLNFFHRNRAIDKFEYVGVDLRGHIDWLTKVSWKNGPTHLVQADVSRDKLDWLGQFDLVVSFETWEHVPVEFQWPFIQLLFKMTAPGGYCLVSTPNAGVSDSTAENHIDEQGRSREMTYKQKLAWEEEAGFEVEGSYGTFIQKRKIPAQFKDMLGVQDILEFMTYGFGNISVAAPFPEQSNNSLQVLWRPT